MCITLDNKDFKTTLKMDNIRFCHPELDKETNSEGCRSENARYRWDGGGGSPGGGVNFN